MLVTEEIKLKEAGYIRLEIVFKGSGNPDDRHEIVGLKFYRADGQLGLTIGCEEEPKP